ncbi:hypothetical protein [Saccharothrix sp. ALI-22-I]|nr:hypothetical protein [Saccharothrix sp. ALI-22-I]
MRSARIRTLCACSGVSWKSLAGTKLGAASRAELLAALREILADQA